MILLFKIRDASGERKYLLITASNLTELTFSKDVLLKCSFKGAVSRNSAKLGNYKMPVKLRET